MDKPLLFIGSSTESLVFAKKLADYLIPAIEVKFWSEAFNLGDTNIETLFRQLDSTDYAVLVATCDDKVIIRGKKKPAARDNVLFESGLFMGRLGRKRTFLVCDQNLKLPTDLAGVTVATFNYDEKEHDDFLQVAADKIRKAIAEAQSLREVDFLRAYIEFIDPTKVELWHTYAEILRNQYDKIKSELNRLRQHNDWRRLLKLKERLREYFEYAGMYKEGIEFGQCYVDALIGLGRQFEAHWSKVKDVGYMLILSGNYKQGRDEIFEVLKVLSHPSIIEKEVSPERLAELLFYANRYLAVSYYRDKAGCDPFKAHKYLENAKAALENIPPESNTYRELNARLLRNQGHLKFEEGNIQDAIIDYRESLILFGKIGDVEHIGTSQLSLAKALIQNNNKSLDEAYDLLKRAETAYSQIGWVEGQARVQEQLAKLLLTSAAKTRSNNRKNELLREAQAALDSSEVMFERIHLGRFQGRLNELRGQWLRAIQNIPTGAAPVYARKDTP